MVVRFLREGNYRGRQAFGQMPPVTESGGLRGNEEFLASDAARRKGMCFRVPWEVTIA